MKNEKNDALSCASLTGEILAERLYLALLIKKAFLQAYPERPLRLARGKLQRHLLELVEASLNTKTQVIVTQVLRHLGYRKVKIRGSFFYRRL